MLTKGLPLKYRLSELMAAIPRGVSSSDITRILAANYGITKATFYHHRGILLGSSSTISEVDLAKYAAFFGVSESEIRNYKPVDKREAKSLFEILRIATPAPKLFDVAALAGMSAPH